MQPRRVPKPTEIDAFNAYVDARVESADRQAEVEATDPDEGLARAQEGRLLRILIAMVIAIVAGGFVISIVGILLTSGR